MYIYENTHSKYNKREGGIGGKMKPQHMMLRLNVVKDAISFNKIERQYV